MKCYDLCTLVRTLSSGTAILLFIATLMALVYRAHHGIDFYDESFYVAVPYRMWLGGRLFIDELASQQTFAIFTYPVLWLRALWRTSNEGLVLDFRLVFVLFWGTSHLLISRVLNAKLAWSLSLVSLTTAALFLPGELVNFSYNTIASVALMAGFALLWKGQDEDNQRSWGIAGIFFGMAAVAYPTLTPMVLLSFLGRGGSRRAFLIGTATPLFLLGLFLLTRLDGVRDYVAFAKINRHNDLLSQIVKLLQSQAVRNFVFGLVASLAVAVCLRRCRSYRMGTVIFVVFLPFFAFAISRSTGRYDFGIVMLSFAPALSVFLEDQPSTRRTLCLVWLPSLVAGFLVSCSSYWLAGRFLVGALAGYVVTIFFACELLVKSFPKFGELVALSWLGLFLLNHWHYPWAVFMEDGPSELVHRIESGPFKGIYTSGVKAKFLNELQADLAPFGRGPGPVFAYQMFPAAYLLTERPAAVSASLFNGSSSEIIRTLTLKFSSSISENSLVICAKSIPVTTSDRWEYHPIAPTFLDTLVRSTHKLTVSKASHDIFLRKLNADGGHSAKTSPVE